MRAGEAHECYYLPAFSKVSNGGGGVLVERVQVYGFIPYLRVGTDKYPVDEEGGAESSEQEQWAGCGIKGIDLCLVLIRAYGVYLFKNEGSYYHGYVLDNGLQWSHLHTVAKAAAIAGITLLHDHEQQVNDEDGQDNDHRIVREMAEEDLEEQEQSQHQLQPYKYARGDAGHEYAADAKIEKGPLEAIECIIVCQDTQTMKLYAGLSVSGIKKGSW